MKLNKKYSVQIIPTTPFDFDSTFHKPDHFTTGDNYWEPGTRWQTFEWKGSPLGVVFKNSGTKNKPCIDVLIQSNKKLTDSELQEFVAEIRYRYNLDLELTEFYESYTSDKTLGPIIKRYKGMRPGHPSSLYEYLIIGIVLQNATVRRSVQMFTALLEKFGTSVEFDDKKLWCFWEPGGLRNTTEGELRLLKVGYRARSIKNIDDQFAVGLIDEMELRRKDRETQMLELLKLYGVGPATVWYLLFDVFHHWDFFNHISPWEQKIYSKLFFDRDPDDLVEVGNLLKHFEKYGKYKQLAVHYIWEDLWWKRKYENIPWLEKLIRV